MSQTSTLQALPRPVYFRTYELTARTRVEPHRHDWWQFLFARRGAMQIEFGGSVALVPPLYGMWIPHGLEHSVMTLETVALESLYIRSEEIVRRRMPPHCRVVVVHEFARSFIHHASTETSEFYDPTGKEGRKVDVLIDVLDALPDAALVLQFPVEPRWREMCETILAAPAEPHRPQEWARQLNVSPRSFARHFRERTGLTFQEWRQKARLMTSIGLMRAGNSVTATALEVGYSSTSAYVHAFRGAFGASPTRFRRGLPSITTR